jgi:hypothetical protein
MKNTGVKITFSSLYSGRLFGIKKPLEHSQRLIFFMLKRAIEGSIFIKLPNDFQILLLGLSVRKLPPIFPLQ